MYYIYVSCLITIEVPVVKSGNSDTNNEYNEDDEDDDDDDDYDDDSYVWHIKSSYLLLHYY